MQTRVAIIAIMVEKGESVPQIQAVLSEYSDYIIGRMGIPYKPRHIKIISIAIDAPTDMINALTGKIGRLDGVNAKTLYSNI